MREDGTALQYMMLMRLFPGISLLTYQRGRHSGGVGPARNRRKTRGNEQLKDEASRSESDTRKGTANLKT